MKIHWKKELYSISIEQGDPLFKPLGMGGTELEWRKLKNIHTKEQIKLIEDVFLETRAKEL
jgi:hypothetical protein